MKGVANVLAQVKLNACHASLATGSLPDYNVKVRSNSV